MKIVCYNLSCIKKTYSNKCNKNEIKFANLLKVYLINYNKLNYV